MSQQILTKEFKKEFAKEKIKNDDLNKKTLSDLKLLYKCLFDEEYFFMKNKDEQKKDIIKALKTEKKCKNSYIDAEQKIK